MNRRRVIVDFHLSEDIFDFGEEALTLGLVFDAGERPQLLHQLTLALTELGWSLHTDLDDQVAFAVSAKDGNTLPFYTQRSSRLRALRDFQDVIAVKRRNGDLRA